MKTEICVDCGWYISNGKRIRPVYSETPSVVLELNKVPICDECAEKQRLNEKRRLNDEPPKDA